MRPRVGNYACPKVLRILMKIIVRPHVHASANGRGAGVLACENVINQLQSFRFEPRIAQVKG